MTTSAEYETRLERALEMLAAGEVEEAKTLLENLVQASSERRAAWFALGEAYLRLGQLDLALPHYELLVGKRPRDPAASAGLFQSLWLLRRYGRALEEVARYLPESNSADYKEYVREFAIERTARDPRERRAVAQVQGLLDGSSAEALRAFAAEADANASLKEELGKWLRTRGDLEQAEQAFSAAIEFNDNGWGRLYLGNVFYAEGRLNEAEREFSVAKDLLPELAVPLWCLGDVFNSRGDSSSAESHYRRAVELEPGQAWAQARLGRFLLRAGRHEEGMDRLTEALELDPHCSPAIKSLREFAT